jgi:hypothetical protein
MAGRIAYYGNIVKDGLVLNLDAGKRDSYPGIGTAWNDVSGFQNNGTLINGPTFNSNNAGSIVFDGISDKIECASTPTLDLTSTISLEIMMYPTLLNQNCGLLNKWTTGGGGINNSYAFYLGQDSTNSRYGFIIFQSNNIGVYLLPSTNYSINTWTHIVCTADGSTMRIYKDGVVDPLTRTYNGTIKSTTKKLVIGSLREEDSIYNYTGRVGFSRIYNRALSATEVLQNYNATKGRYL